MAQELIVYNSFKEFYPYYLKEHTNRTNRRLHFIGTTLGFLTIAYALLTGQYKYLLLALVFGYGFAWAGHFFIEKNKPATFKYPIWSFRGDMKMYTSILSGKVKF
ncbi:hypothetical protein ACTFIU_008234 [Dictyostelium citrinum]